MSNSNPLFIFVCRSDSGFQSSLLSGSKSNSFSTCTSLQRPSGRGFEFHPTRQLQSSSSQLQSNPSQLQSNLLHPHLTSLSQTNCDSERDFTHTPFGSFPRRRALSSNKTSAAEDDLQDNCDSGDSRSSDSPLSQSASPDGSANGLTRSPCSLEVHCGTSPDSSPSSPLSSCRNQSAESFESLLKTSLEDSDTVSEDEERYFSTGSNSSGETYDPYISSKYLPKPSGLGTRSRGANNSGIGFDHTDRSNCWSGDANTSCSMPVSVNADTTHSVSDNADSSRRVSRDYDTSHRVSRKVDKPHSVSMKVDTSCHVFMDVDTSPRVSDNVITSPRVSTEAATSCRVSRDANTSRNISKNNDKISSRVSNHADSSHRMSRNAATSCGVLVSDTLCSANRASPKHQQILARRSRSMGMENGRQEGTCIFPFSYGHGVWEGKGRHTYIISVDAQEQTTLLLTLTHSDFYVVVFVCLFDF